jgi:hypothetical protein
MVGTHAVATQLLSLSIAHFSSVPFTRRDSFCARIYLFGQLSIENHQVRSSELVHNSSLHWQAEELRIQQTNASDEEEWAMAGATALKQNETDADCWRGFKSGSWQASIDVRDFIVKNVTPYAGDETFLAGPSKRTKAVWAKLQPFFQEERKKGVLAVDARNPSTLFAHKAGYIQCHCGERNGSFKTSGAPCRRRACSCARLDFKTSSLGLAVPDPRIRRTLI